MPPLTPSLLGTGVSCPLGVLALLFRSVRGAPWQSQPSCRQVAPVVPSCAAQLDRGGLCGVCHAGAVQAAWRCCCPPCCAIPCCAIPCHAASLDTRTAHCAVQPPWTAHRAMQPLYTHSPGASTFPVLLGEFFPLRFLSAPPWIPHWFATPHIRCSLAVQSLSSCPHGT